MFCFVCLGKTRKSILLSLCLEGSNNPWEWLHTDVRTVVQNLIRHGPRASIKEHCGAEFNQTRTTCINQWLTLYKLTGWFASLDLRKPHTEASSTTKITTPGTLTFCCRGFACSLEFRRTLKIITHILCEVVNRVKLHSHHTQKAFAR